MVDFFTYLYTATVNNNKLLDRLRLNSLFRVIIRNVANLLIPSYFILSNLFYKNKLEPQPNKEDGLIVTLTSFPARIGKLWIVIECMFRQSHRPDKIILWLSKEQFDDVEKLPKKLLNLKRKGLEIYLCDGDLKSHKKYYYAIRKYSNSTFITIDDDVFYLSNFIENLITYHNKYPNSIIMNRGKKITLSNSSILPYKQWGQLKGEFIKKIDIIPTGIGGVLYYPGCLHEMVIKKDMFMKTCPMADDLWLFFMAHINNVPFTKTIQDNLMLPVINKNNETLTSVNVGNNLNDTQFKNIHKQLNKTFNKEVLRFL